ncbi:MAG: SUMF1/EgtB/PvdO family nonheme iron enzyme [Planctomycetota bacterium]|nr:SUMF1/EgtB/PvdO family nonheme iron enzyme [Planctomycetota bacterium]MDA0933874.1 SUMF1/EgtB/PvdO family nonheme iron enzyme [Planctomycetota bacterium]MDA1222839.1 SUMF1/EgtB/PvdO family nonheme iron enzyme [Planctomycetota bacterium]
MTSIRRVLSAAALGVVAACEPAFEVPREAPIDLAVARAPSTWAVGQDGEGRVTRTDPRTGLVFVRVPATESTRGGLSDVDTPRHRVRISNDLWVSTTEVTVGAWRTFVARDGGAIETWPLHGWLDEEPIRGISHADAAAFCDAYGYRLPTEAEWETFCRAGRDDVVVSRDDVLTEAWCHANAGGRVHPVASRSANALGLYDCLGNVWEFTSDGLLPRYVVTDEAQVLVDPRVPAGTGPVVIRGGSFFSIPIPWPSDRMYAEQDLRSPVFGFRVVVSAGE